MSLLARSVSAWFALTSWTTLATALIPFVVVALYHITRHKISRQVLQLPEPSGDEWLWGHQRLIFANRASEAYIQWMGSLGSAVYRIKATVFQTYTPEIVIGDGLAAQYIFRNAYTYVKSPEFRPLVQKLLGRGVVWAEGDEHRHQRKVVSSAFSIESTKDMLDDIVQCTEALISKLTRNVQAAGKVAIVDLSDVLSACTLDVIGRIAFAHDFQSGASPEAQMIHAAWANDVLDAHSFLGFLAPIILNIAPWIVKLPISRFRTDGISKRITQDIARNMLNSNSESTSTKRDILSLLRTEYIQGRLTHDQLLDNISTFLMVGHETTSGTIAFTLYELALNAEVQGKLRQEVKASRSRIEYDGLQKLEYLDAVIREGLRLHPPASPTKRLALTDDTIPLAEPVELANGKKITSLDVKAGQVFHIPWLALNVNPFMWGKNSREFLPERWLSSSGVPCFDNLPHGPWGRISTFCDGPRSCIGYRLAVLEMKVIIFMLIRNFRFEWIEGKVFEEYISPTLQPSVDGKIGQLPLRVCMLDD